MATLRFDCARGPVALHYETAGDGPGAPVLLIMGLGGLGRGWSRQVDGLAAHHPVAWFDNRGVGRTTAPPGRSSMPLFAEDVRRLLDHLDWPVAHVVGASMGGMIAQEFALRDPRRVTSLSLIVSHAGGARARLPRPRGVVRALRVATAPPERRPAALERLLFPAEHLATADRDDLKQRLASSFPPIPRRSLLAQLSAVVGHHTADRLHQLADTPTLIVQARRDILINPRESARLHRLIPGSRLVTFDDAGHGVIRQKAAELNATLLDHFARSADRARASA